MEEIDINKYIDLGKRHILFGASGDFVDRIVIDRIVIDRLGIPLDFIKEYLSTARVSLKEEDIKSFLAQKEKENSEINDITHETKSEAFMYEFMQMLDTTYKFNPVTLEYFKTYLDRLKENVINLVNLIDNIGNYSYKDLFNSLDISVVNGKIHYKDALRIVKPLIYNVLKIKEIGERANNKETYLSFNINEDLLGRDGITLYDLYPKVAYQVPSEMLSQDGYIKLTDYQVGKMIEEEEKQMDDLIDFTNKLIKKC